MYMRLLEEAVSEKRGKKAEKTDCKVDLKLNAYISDPAPYLMELRQAQTIRVFNNQGVAVRQIDSCFYNRCTD